MRKIVPQFSLEDVKELSNPNLTILNNLVAKDLPINYVVETATRPQEIVGRKRRSEGSSVERTKTQFSLRPTYLFSNTVNGVVRKIPSEWLTLFRNAARSIRNTLNVVPKWQWERIKQSFTSDGDAKRRVRRKTQLKITDGFTAMPHSWPWQVRLCCK